MRTADSKQHTVFSYRNLEERIPANHTLRKLRVLVDNIHQFDERHVCEVVLTHRPTRDPGGTPVVS